MTTSVTAVTSDLTAHRRTLKPLTGIRFFAAIDVVILHTKLGTSLTRHGHVLAGTFILHGGMAVSLFFLLSGFILAYTYKGQMQRPGGYRRFWEARFARIWPVYVVSLLFTSAVLRAFPKPSYVVATLLMVQAWNPFDNAMWGAWNFVCWTISAEAFFYLCFPWVQQWLERCTPRRQLWVGMVVLLVCVGLNLSVYVQGYGRGSWLDVLPLPLKRIPEFVVGMALGNFFLSMPARTRRGESRQLFLFPGFWTYLWTAAAAALLCMPDNRWSSAVTAAFAAMIFGLAAEDTLFSRFLSTDAMLLGGGISYSIYLLQDPVKDLIKKVCDHLHLGSAAVRVAAMAILLPAFSYLLFEAVEKPARDALRKLFSRLEQRRA